jgi:hypothetical protein
LANIAAVASATRGDRNRPLRLRAAYTIDGDSTALPLTGWPWASRRQWKWLKVVV